MSKTGLWRPEKGQQATGFGGVHAVEGRPQMKEKHVTRVRKVEIKKRDK